MRTMSIMATHWDARHWAFLAMAALGAAATALLTFAAVCTNH
jgi:hypothetical protein